MPEPIFLTQEPQLVKNLLLFALSLFAACAWANVDEAAKLQAKYLALDEQLTRNPFNRPLVLTSSGMHHHVSGEIHAVLNHPFSAVSKHLQNPDSWCDLLSLPMNTKYCRAQAGAGGPVLNVHIGTKAAQRLEDAPRIEFSFTRPDLTAQFLEIRLDAQNGPLGTSNYKIAFKAVPLSVSPSSPSSPATARGQTFIQLTYSYSVNLTARLAMQAYLATAGRNKVGFTQIGLNSDGTTRWIDGVRGVVERNTMRYYLAIDSYLESATEPAPIALEKRLQSWFTASELFSRQLHELERGEYLAMKREEYARQHTVE